MDIFDIKPCERMVEIIHPGTKNPIGIRVTLVHLDDPRLVRLRRKFYDEKERLAQRGKIVKSDQVEDNANELAFAAMTSWEWYNPTGIKGDAGYDPDKTPHIGGNTAPEFNRQTVFELFEKAPWFRDQIGAEIGDQEAFFTN